MNKVLSFLMIVLVGLQVTSCKTDDVLIQEQPVVGGDNLVEVADLALGEYLIYNRIPGVYKLKDSDIARTDEYKIYIDTVEVKAVKTLSLVKNASAITKLEQAGLATASVKIKSFDEVRFFTGVTKLQLTSNEIGALNLNRLTQLDTLEINFNYLSTLDLTKNTKLRRFRFQGSTNEVDEVRRISTIDLSNSPDIEHIHLKDQDIVTIVLPAGIRLKDLDVSNTPGPDNDRTTADVVIPQATYDNIIANGGLPLGVTTGSSIVIPANAYQINDLAFGEYLVYLVGQGALPENAAYTSDGKFFINKDVVVNVEVLNVAKTTSDIATLTSAGLSTAANKITSVDGIQFFTALKSFTATSNEIASLSTAALTGLETLAINNNYIGTLDLTKNVNLKVLSYNASSKSTDSQKLSTLDLTKNILLETVSLKNHKLQSIDLSKNVAIATADFTGNPGVDGSGIAIPADVYDSLTQNGAVLTGISKASSISASWYEIKNAAFAEFLVYLTGNGTLPEGTAFVHTDGLTYINKDIAKTATVLNVSKSATVITTLTEAGLTTASVKIADVDGLQFFTGLVQFTATSNEIASLNVDALVNLETLQINFNFITSLNLDKNVKLKLISYNASSKATASQKLSSIDFTKNTLLSEISMTNQNLTSIDLSKNTGLTKVDLTGNAGAPFTIPAEIYDNLTTAKGVQK